MAEYSQICTITSRTNADNAEMDKKHPPARNKRACASRHDQREARGTYGRRGEYSVLEFWICGARKQTTADEMIEMRSTA